MKRRTKLFGALFVVQLVSAVGLAWCVFRILDLWPAGSVVLRCGASP